MEKIYTESQANFQQPHKLIGIEKGGLGTNGLMCCKYLSNILKDNENIMERNLCPQ